MHRIGFGAEADRVRAAFPGASDRDGAAKLVTDEMVDAVTILGTPKQCREQMQRFFDAGVQEIRLVFNEPDKDAYLKALRAVAPRARARGAPPGPPGAERRGRPDRPATSQISFGSTLSVKSVKLWWLSGAHMR